MRKPQIRKRVEPAPQYPPNVEIRAVREKALCRRGCRWQGVGGGWAGRKWSWCARGSSGIPGPGERLTALPVGGYQIGEAAIGVGLPLVGSPARLARASASVMVDFHLLHVRCIRRQFLRSYCEPPLMRGRSSSTSALMGWGTHPGHPVWGHLGPCSPGLLVRLLSTGLSQSAQMDSSANTRLRNSLRLCPFELRVAISPPGRILGA